MPESSHEIVAAKAERVWEILRLLQKKTDDEAPNRQEQPPPATVDYIQSPTWDS
jgi:hypothetical protein